MPEASQGAEAATGRTGGESLVSGRYGSIWTNAAADLRPMRPRTKTPVLIGSPVGLAADPAPGQGPGSSGKSAIYSSAAQQFSPHPELIQAGAKLRKDTLPNNGKLHHKVLVLDGTVSIAGSFNYTGSANQYNDGITGY